MPKLIQLDGVGTVEFPDDATQDEVLAFAETLIPSTRGGFDYLEPLPPITAEQLGEEYVSHPALPLASKPREPSVLPPDSYLPPLTLPATQEEFAQRFAESEIPWSQRPGISVLGAPEDTYIQGGIMPRIPIMGKEGTKLRTASEFAKSTQESLARGIEGMTTPEATRLLPLLALPYVGPAAAAVFGTDIVSSGLGKLVTGAELHDPLLSGEGFGEVLVGSPLLRAAAGKPSGRPSADDARFARARRITQPLRLTQGTPPEAAPTRPAPDVPPTPAEAAEMTRVREMPETPAAEAQLVAEDIARAVADIDVSDLAGSSPVPALVRLIRRAPRDPAMKTAAEQAMQKVGEAARAQGVPLDTLKTQLAGELQAVYGADAPEMAKYYFGEEPAKPAAPSAEEQAAAPEVPAARAEEAPAAQPAEPAPAAPTPPAAAQAKAQTEVSRVAATEGKRSAKDIKAELVTRLEQAVKDAPTAADTSPTYHHKVSGERVETPPKIERTQVTIDIPDDGTFTVWNTKENLQSLLKRAKAINTAPAKSQYGGVPTVRPKAVPKAKGDMPALARFVSTDKTRYVLQSAWSDGSQVMATDGRMMLVVEGKHGGTSAKPVAIDPATGKRVEVEGEPPKYQQVVPSASELKSTVEVPVAELNELVRQARPLFVEAETSKAQMPWVNLHVSEKGEVGLSAKSEYSGDTLHAGNTTSPIIGTYDASRLRHLIDAAGELGATKVKLSTSTNDKSNGALVLQGDRWTAILQGRGTDAAAAEAPAPVAPSASPFFPRRSEAQGLGEQATAPTVEDVRRQRLLDREGTPVPPSPSNPTPPPAEPPAAELSAPDEPAITDAIRRQDVMPGRDWLASPEFEFRKDPVAGPLVTRIVEAELGYQAQVSRDLERFRNLARGLTKPQREAITSALRAAQAGNRAPLDALSAPHRAVADDIRAYFDEVRGVIIAGKQADLIDGMTEARGAAVRDILGGMDEAEAFRTHRLRAPGQAAVRQALRELDDLEHWGIDDYITNIERGSYRVVTPDGTTVAVAETRVGAKEKALKYGRDHPGTTRLTITDEFSSSAEFPTKLTRGQYFRMAQRAANALSTDVREIQRMLRAEGSPVVVVKPPSKFAGPMQHRYGVLEGEADIFDALPAYAYSVRKKLALDPVLKQARTDLPKLPENTQKQVEELIGDVRGRYSLADQIADYVLAPLGRKPFAVSRGVGVARTVAAALKLGYRPVTALVNRLGGLQHTWTKAGTRHWIEARRFIRTPEFHEIWLRNADLVGAHAQAFTEAGHADVPWYHPLSMFQFAERVNRPEAFAAFYKHAQGELGMDGPGAEAYARKATRFAQFTYTVGSLPRLLRSPPGRLIGQFKAYLVKEMEFVSSLRGFEIPRYLSAFFALGGPRAFIYFLRSLPVLGAIGALWALEDWLNRKAPRASRGIPGYLGVDLTAAVTPQLPTRPSDWLGPSLSDAMRLWTDVLRPALQGERRDFSDVKDWGTKLAPTLDYWTRMLEALGDKQGWITDERGRLLYKPSAGGKIALSLGAKPLEQAVAEVNRAYLAHINAVALKNRARLIDQILNALDKGDGATLDKLIKDAADYGIDTDVIRNAAKQREREPDERLRRRLLKSVRVQEADRLANPPTP